ASATESTVTAPPPPQGYGIFKSEDKGSTWTKLTVAGTDGAKPTDLEMDPQNSNTLYAGFMGKGIFKSTNGGANWCPLNPGISVAGCVAATFSPVAPTNFDHVELAIHRPTASPAILYAMFGDCPNPILSSCKPSIYKSTDGGNSWTRTFTGDPTEVLTTSCPYVYSRYTHALTIDPTNSNTLFVGGVSLCRSPDSGASFSLVGANIHLDHHAVVFASSDPMRVYDVSDGGFAFSMNGGLSWLQRNRDLQITGFQSIASSPSTQRVIGGAQDNGINRWDGTREWQFVDDSDSGATIIHPTDSMKMYATMQNVSPSRSGNGGASWSDFGGGDLNVGDPHAFYPPFVQDHTSPYPLYLGTNRLYKRIDDGVSNWVRVSPVLGGTAFFDDIRTTNVITAIAVAPSNPNRIYIGYYDGQIWVSKSGGPCDSTSCWDKVSDGKGLPQAVVTRIAVHPTAADTAYVTFSGFGIGAHVFKTMNGGDAWSSASGAGAGALPDIPANTISIEPSAPERLWLGTDFGVFKSVDSGASWMPFSTGLPNVPVYEISIDESRGRVWAATHGRGAFILTQPFLSNFEGWVNNGIWDIPVYGHGFVPNSTPCKLRIIQQNGNTCAMGSVDVMGGAITIDGSGQLVTSNGGFYMGKPVAWACYNGNCLGNTPISACNQPANRISAVTATCTAPFGGGMSVGLGLLLGCPQLNNPPSSVLGLTGNPGPTFAPSPATEAGSALAAGAFDLVPTVQSGDGTSRALCAVRVPFEAGDTPEQILNRALDAVNANTACAANTVTASVSPSRDPARVEDEFVTEPRLALAAPGVNGGELFTSLHAAPGSAASLCFNVGSIGVPVVNSLIISKLKFETQPGGAAGGTITVTERSGLGTCEITIPTSSGASAANIATALANAFQAPGIPGPHPGCPSR